MLIQMVRPFDTEASGMVIDRTSKQIAEQLGLEKYSAAAYLFTANSQLMYMKLEPSDIWHCFGPERLFAEIFGDNFCSLSSDG